MADSSGGSRDQLLEELRSLVSKSVEANTRLIQNGSDLLRRLSAREVDLAKLTEQGRELLAVAVEDAVRLSAAHTSRLIDLGLEISNRLAGAVPAVSQPAPEAPQPRSPVFDLKLSGPAGSLCQTAFVLESDRTEPVSASFNYSLFVDAAGENAHDLPIRFEPERVELDPGERQNVVLGVEIPRDTPPGPLQTIVGIDGMPGLAFRLTLDVQEAAPRKKTTPTSRTRRKPAGKKAATRKKPKRSAGAKGAKKTPAKRAAAKKAAAKRAAPEKRRPRKKAAAKKARSRKRAAKAR